MSEKSEIERVFCLMDRWRHLPAYQLERRADIFFALFLPKVLEKHFGTRMNPILIPEFPIKNRTNNQSSKVDYLALQQAEDGCLPKRAFLVELKTDMASKRDEQDYMLRDAVDRGLRELIEGVLVICKATNEKEKYVHLLKLLSEAGLIEFDDRLWPVKRGFSEVVSKVEIKVTRDEPRLEVVYVQPYEHIIDFKEFASVIEGSGDIGPLFAKHLRKWTDVAGSRNPKESRSC